jgi:hypothetical protein
MMGELGRAIRENQLCLYYQPKVILDENRCYGFEALIRWIHPELGFVPPNDFIPIAEFTSLIHPLTAWVLEKSIEQCRRWHARADSDFSGLVGKFFGDHQRVIGPEDGVVIIAPMARANGAYPPDAANLLDVAVGDQGMATRHEPLNHHLRSILQDLLRFVLESLGEEHDRSQEEDHHAVDQHQSEILPLAAKHRAKGEIEETFLFVDPDHVSESSAKVGRRGHQGTGGVMFHGHRVVLKWRAQIGHGRVPGVAGLGKKAKVGQFESPDQSRNLSSLFLARGLPPGSMNKGQAEQQQAGRGQYQKTGRSAHALS